MVAGSIIIPLDQTHNVLAVDDGVNLLTNYQHQAVNFFLPLLVGSKSVTDTCLWPRPPSTVVSALRGGCSGAAWLASLAPAEPGAGGEAVFPPEELPPVELALSSVVLMAGPHVPHVVCRGRWCVCVRASLHKKKSS